MNEFDQARQTFFDESRDMLREIEDALLVLESGGGDAETLNGLFRAAHTIKGSAGLFGYEDVVAFTHEVETVLDRLRAGELAFGEELAGLMLACADHVSSLLAELESGNTGETADRDRGTGLVTRLRSLYATPEATTRAASPAVEASSDAPASGPCRWRIDVRFGADVFRNGMDPLSFIRYLGTRGELVRVVTRLFDVPPADRFDAETCHLALDILVHTTASREELEKVFDFVRDDCTLVLTRVTEGAPSVETTGTGAVPTEGGTEPVVAPEVVNVAMTRQKEQRAEEARFIRVQADKLDELISLVGELVIAGAGATLVARQIRHMGMLEATQSISDLVEEIRNSALQLRMVQIGDTFARFRRVVRDVSHDLGKEIELEIRGADTELDKSVVEKIADPLMHLVRNAMDHGIETGDERAAAGKPRAGHLRLNAYHDSGSIVIEVQDDGRGLDRARILRKAVERGIVPENTELPEDEVFGLIFMPGFSTAETVTNLSGRGVGMDVVKRNIESLRGTVHVASTPGAGTKMAIRLPLTLAIIDGFLVTVGRSSYVIPLDMVVECIELPADIPAHAQHFNLRGEVLPFLRMRDVFQVEDSVAGHESVVVVRNGTSRAGLVVDRLLGELQAVIKPLGRIFRDLQGIGGSTILGSGEVALILDVPALIARATRNSTLAGPATAGIPRSPGRLLTEIPSSLERE
ncbi:MAG: chemotaxis protein CheA [Betaproteobacteria bacterium]|nr:chemotaxis protein CheA [Betaproteobacteria bacterium]